MMITHYYIRMKQIKRYILIENYFLLTDEYFYIKSFIINGEKIIKYTGEASH